MQKIYIIKIKYKLIKIIIYQLHKKILEIKKNPKIKNYYNNNQIYQNFKIIKIINKLII